MSGEKAPRFLTVYSHELGIEHCIHREDIEQASVVVAVLRQGRSMAPTTLEHIESIYCPSCGWMTPDESHINQCPYIWAVIR